MSADQTVRAFVQASLQLPAEWVVIPEQRFPDTIAKTTVVLQHSRIERLSEAPIGWLRSEVVMSVLVPQGDIGAAENAADDALVEILSALDGHSDINWTGAEKVLHNGAYVAWNVTLTVITGRPVGETESDPEEV